MDGNKRIRGIREAMRAEKDAKMLKRMMAVHGVLGGYSTKDAAYFADVDQRTVQEWVARFHSGGVDCLRDSPGRGRTPRLSYGRVVKLAAALLPALTSKAYDTHLRV